MEPTDLVTTGTFSRKKMAALGQFHPLEVGKKAKKM